MKAMILAAGRGARMGELTLKTPKPLLKVCGKPLIFWHLEKLAQSGFREVVVNHAWLGEQIEAALGDGSQWGLNIRFSAEAVALETAGGILKALPLLGNQPFAVISADIFCDYNFARLRTIGSLVSNFHIKGYCVMVNNPRHNPTGDFGCQNGLMCNRLDHKFSLTYSGIGVFTATLFEGLRPDTPIPLRDLLRRETPLNQIGAELYSGIWDDVGTPERLANMNSTFQSAGNHQGSTDP